jgi:hypothetical protein
MLFAIFKAAFVAPAISPLVHALTLPNVFVIVAFVGASVWPSEFTVAVHFVIVPSACVNTTITV